MTEINAAGQLFDLFTSDEVEAWVDVMKKIPCQTYKGNDCHGIDENNIYNFWFQKTIFPIIQDLFGKDLKLIFGMLLDEKKPWKIHTDAYHVKDFKDRVPALSFLIPYSVDNNTKLVDCSRTIVFNELADDNTRYKEWETLLEDKINYPDSAASIAEQHLSHNSIELINKLTLQGVYQWKANSLIYWNSRNLHDSDNFLKNGYNSKQAIVIHTYKNR